MARVETLDSTLRDGAQGEGICFSLSDKAAIARALDALGVDIIEAGNPSSNPKDMEFFAKAGGLGLSRSRIAAFGPTRRKGRSAEEDEGLAGLLAAGTETVVLFGKSWDLHVREVLRASPAENIEMIADSVAWLVSRGRRVVYDAEHFFDGYASDPDYALETIRAAARAGAELVALCDTNGGSLPAAVARATGRAASGLGVPVGIHAHDDSGLAVANSLAAVEAGAVHVQGTFLGFGERCGNACLAVLAADLSLKMGMDCLAAGALAMLAPTARRIAEIANVAFDESTPYVGRKAFAHKAGMHVDAVAKAPETFEHVSPETVGNARRILASEVGGRSVVAERMRSIAPEATKDSPAVADALARLKELEAAGYQFEGADASLEILMRKAAGKYSPFFELHHYRTMGEQPAPDRTRRAQAIVKISVDGEEELSAAEGDGPVHALDLALRRALERFYPSLARMRLTDFKVRVVDGSAATAAVVRVLIESADQSDAWTTVGVSTDIIEASWIALVDSIEYKLIKDMEKRHRSFSRERTWT